MGGQQAVLCDMMRKIRKYCYTLYVIDNIHKKKDNIVIENLWGRGI